MTSQQEHLIFEMIHSLEHAVDGIRGYLHEAHGMVPMIASDSPAVARLSRALERAMWSAEVTSSHLECLRAAAMPELELWKRPIDVSKAVEFVARTLGPIAGERHIEIRLDTVPASVLAEERFLQAALLQLALHVLRSAHRKSTLCLSARKEVENVIIEYELSPASADSDYPGSRLQGEVIDKLLKAHNGNFLVDFVADTRSLLVTVQLPAVHQ